MPLSPSEVGSPAANSSASSTSGGGLGEGYTCPGCLDGWSCVPPQTPISRTATACLESTTTVTVCPETSPTETLHPAVADWAFGGCYNDDASRALKNSSIVAPIPGGMTNALCIMFCRSQGFTLAGTEGGFQCFCGDVLFDSWLIDESSCKSPCAGDVDAACFCGGDLALSVWSPDGKVKKAFSVEHFAIPDLLPGQTELSLAMGGVRQTVVRVTTPVYMWPEAAATTSETAQAVTTSESSIDVDGIASTVHAIVSAAVKEAQAIAASEIAKASSMIADARAAVGKGFESIAGELNAHDGNIQHYYNLYHIWLALNPLGPFSSPPNPCYGHPTIKSYDTQQQSNRVWKCSAVEPLGVTKQWTPISAEYPKQLCRGSQHYSYAFSESTYPHANICRLASNHRFSGSCNRYLSNQSRCC
ncbi:hypothetical protein B0T25DRAFT_571334 [Lasiosphaeria hispida]|uniref:WSC domain-containing protein n=1 Tax=Lasiosphaeria hispida TaxID=260671 RepID=A0AAJ0HAT7_9PEZI|nr:hypothetical protein B0T25DRAFT_571334 [Lasiosphaeria hispida]